MAMHLFLFCGAHNYYTNQRVYENYDIYVRAERKRDVLRLVLEHYDWYEGSEDEGSDAEIIAAYADDGFSIHRKKTYPADANVVAGVVPWSDVVAML